MAKVVLHHAEMTRILKSAPLAAELHRRAARVAAAAIAAAPVVTGNYRDGIKVVDEVHPSRVVSRVYATAPHSHLVEANTGNLARALDAAGGADPNRLVDYTTKSGKKRKATQAQVDNWTRGR